MQLMFSFLSSLVQKDLGMYVQTSKNDICVCLVIQEIHEGSLHKMVKFDSTQTLKIVSTLLNERTPFFNSLVQRDA